MTITTGRPRASRRGGCERRTAAPRRRGSRTRAGMGRGLLPPRKTRCQAHAAALPKVTREPGLAVTPAGTCCAGAPQARGPRPALSRKQIDQQPEAHQLGGSLQAGPAGARSRAPRAATSSGGTRKRRRVQQGRRCCRSPAGRRRWRSGGSAPRRTRGSRWPSRTSGRGTSIASTAAARCALMSLRLRGACLALSPLLGQPIATVCASLGTCVCPDSSSLACVPVRV